MVFTITPGKHGVILVRNFGQIVEQFGKFVEALSREAGLGERAFISGLSFTKAGGVKLTITLVKMRRASRSSPPGDGAERVHANPLNTNEGHQQRSAT